MKKIIALTLLLMFLLSSACIASPYVAYADTEKNFAALELNDVQKSLQELERKNEERARKAQQAQGLGIDFDELDRQAQERLQKRKQAQQEARIQEEKERQERMIIEQQRKQQQQKILLCVGAVAVIGIACLYIKRKTIHQWVSTHVTIRKINSLQISQIFLIGFLLTIATIPHWRISDGFYTLLRILTTTISIWSAIKTDNNILKLIFAFIAILFNPIILIELDRDEWEMIDVATALFYLGIVIQSLIKARK